MVIPLSISHRHNIMDLGSKDNYFVCTSSTSSLYPFNSTEYLEHVKGNFLFSQALSSFSAALQSGQLGPLMSQFGLGEAVASAATQGGKKSFQLE